MCYGLNHLVRLKESCPGCNCDYVLLSERAPHPGTIQNGPVRQRADHHPRGEQGLSHAPLAPPGNTFAYRLICFRFADTSYSSLFSTPIVPKHRRMTHVSSKRYDLKPHAKKPTIYNITPN